MPKKRAASKASSRPKRITPRRRTAVTASSPEPKPIPGPEAFNDLQEPNHVQSQAATLLLIGSQLRGDTPAAQARAENARGLMQLRGGPRSTLEAIPREDIDSLGFPSLKASTGRFHSAALQKVAGVRLMAATARLTSVDVRAAARKLPQVADAFYRDANAETAAALLETSLRHPHQLVRVSAAASYFEVAANPQRALGVLEHGLHSRDLLTRDVAAYALAHIDPGNSELRRLVRRSQRPSKRKRSHTALIVHGTWARTSSWWQPPRGDFWKYLHDNVDDSLYGAGDRFEWSGGYSDAARALGGSDLHTWVDQHQLDGLDIYGHSHGANIAMLANQAGTRVRRMVLLSCPVHWPKYSPNFDLVGVVVSVRVRLDLVILADRGGQKFQDSRIQEHILPIWFNHFATHDPGKWQKYDVPAMLPDASAKMNRAKMAAWA
jgi:hypothetical protein